MSDRNFYTWRPDLANVGVLGTTGPTPSGLIIKDTSATGAPTYLHLDGADAGALKIDFSATAEVQNVCLYHGDILPFDIDNIAEAYFRFRLNQAALDASTQFALGLTGDRNDAIDSIAQALLLRIVGADDPTAVVAEYDDGTNTADDIATGKSIADTNAHDFLMSFAKGKSDVRFFLDGQPIAPDTTFNLSAYAGSLQFFAQIQKTANVNVDGFTLEDTYVRGRRSLVA